MNITTKRVGKTSPKLFLKSCRKQPPNAPFCRARKTSRWGSDRTIGRPTGRPPTVIFPTVGAAVDRPVDRAFGIESRALCWSTGLVDRGFPESRSSLAVDRVGRPALQPDIGVHAVHVGHPSGRPTSDFGRPVGRPAEARQHCFGIKKLVIFDSIKSHKIMKNLQK